MIEEIRYCSRAMKMHFNKKLVITKEDNENFEGSTEYWVCGNAFVKGDLS